MTKLTTRDLLAALRLPGVGPSTVRKLYESAVSGAVAMEPFGDELLDRLAKVLRRGAILPSGTVVDSAYKEADDILDSSAHGNIVAISPFDDGYPRALLDLPDFPPILYLKGSLATLTIPKKLAVVGTRQASELGLRLARKIANELSNLNICIVSGLALGIDTAAHQGALKGGGSTIAVMAHGLDQVAPKSNEALAAAILEKNGALLSEYEIGVIPRPPQFVFRNRLQSGLSRGSVVVESGASGGSIYQGKLTLQQHRLLFVVTPEATLPGAAEFNLEGAKHLQKEFEAKAVSRLEDILDSLPEWRQPRSDIATVVDNAPGSDIGSADPSLPHRFSE